MPIYIYQNPNTEEYIEVFQGMNDKHEYFDQSGLEWKRVFLSPNAAIDLDANPFDHQGFIDRTKGAGTMGDLWDRSKEMSEKRASMNGGTDPYKKDYFKNYSSKRKGAKHQLDQSDNH